jgi:S1-C subfamily serine protease
MPAPRSLRPVLAAAAFAAALALPPALPAAFDAAEVDKSVVRVMLVFKRAGVETGFASGTGFVIDRELVVTNDHVIDESAAVAEGQTVEGVVPDTGMADRKPWTVVWRSKELDLAVIRVKGLARPPLTLSAAPPLAEPRRGATVYALGYPAIADRVLEGAEQAFMTASLTRGVVGKTVIARAGGQPRPVIQHDAAINKGSSGGPLFDDCQVVVGVNTYIASATLAVVTDERGNPVARGPTPAGIFVSPHISNLIEAVGTFEALKGVTLRTTDRPCRGSGGVPLTVWIAIGAGVLVAAGAAALVLRKGLRREVARAVEQVSRRQERAATGPAPARKAAPPGKRMADIVARTAGEGDSVLAAAVPEASETARALGSAWVLSGFDHGGLILRVELEEKALQAAAATPEGGLVLGRSGSLSDRKVNDPGVSRRHAKIALGSEGIVIEDLKSAFGTAVNGERLEPFRPRPIRVGDRVTLGAVTLDLSRI